MKALSEDSVCLLTGKTTDLQYYPVDQDTTNPLPCNIACISSDIVKGIGPSFNYTLDVWGYRVTLDTPVEFMKYNKECVSALAMEAAPYYDSPAVLVDVFETLIRRHVKGITKVEMVSENTSHDRFQYLNFQLRLGSKSAKQRSSLII
jgi:hypothetical protein